MTPPVITQGGGIINVEHAPLSVLEIFGLDPLPERLGEALFMLRGDPYTPPSRFDLTSLKILMPWVSIQTWLGHRRPDRRIPIYNLFNHRQTPVEEGWSVRYTQVLDYRGGGNTYDSHNGTDFIVPVGVEVVSPAPGLVIRVSREFHRGGLKIFIDHGQGLVTSSNHLGRALVEEGQRVARGEPIALAGGSGVDMFTLFPWTAPHVHFNVWLNGEYVDPFSREGSGEVSIWRGGNDPGPVRDGESEMVPTPWDGEAIEAAIGACRDPKMRAAFRREIDLGRRGAQVLFTMNYFPTRFERRHHLYTARYERQPMLDLPFKAEDFVGIVHLDD